MRKSPTTLPPVRQHLLFSESEIEQALTSVLQLAHIRTSLNDSSMQSPGKFPFQTESHDDDEEWINEEEIEVPTYLHFYCTSEIPDCLAVVRFTLWDDLGVAAVTEEVYKDAPEEMFRLDSEVQSCMSEGIDCAVMSAYDIEMFPYIYGVVSGLITE